MPTFSIADTALFAGATGRSPRLRSGLPASWKARAIGKGDRVLLWGPNSAEWVAVFFGCALRGVIVVPIDEAGTADFTQRVYQQVEGQALLCSREHVAVTVHPNPVLILEDLHEVLSRHSMPLDAAEIKRRTRSKWYSPPERPPNPREL